MLSHQGQGKQTCNCNTPIPDKHEMPSLPRYNMELRLTLSEHIILKFEGYDEMVLVDDQFIAQCTVCASYVESHT